MYIYVRVSFFHIALNVESFGNALRIYILMVLGHGVVMTSSFCTFLLYFLNFNSLRSVVQRTDATCDLVIAGRTVPDSNATVRFI